MANFVTVSNGLVTREASTSSGLPPLTMSGDPWLDVSALNPRPVVGDHTANEGATFTLNHTTLSAAQAAKIAELRDAAANHIKNLGFLSGSPARVFPSQPKDQENIFAAFTAASIDNEPTNVYSLWSGEPGSTNRVQQATDWAMYEYDLEALKLIAHACRAHVNDAQEELNVECQAVLAATTVAAVNAVVWSSPPT